MNIDIERYPKVTEIKEAGWYFFRSNNGSKSFLGMLYKAYGQVMDRDADYYGPVHFGPCAPHLDLSSLDLSKYPVVDKPDRPGVWRWRNDSGLFGYSCLEEKDFSRHVVYSGETTYQRIGDFTPPAPALPEVPEVELVLIKHPDHEKPMWFAQLNGSPIGPSGSNVLRRVPLAAKEVV